MPPASGTLEIFPDLTFDHSGAADGSWPWVYELFSASGSLGQATVTDVFGTVSHEITISGAQQLNTVDSVAIQQTHLITASNSQQVNTVSSAIATQSDLIYITISDSQQANTVSSVAIQQTHYIGIANSVQRNTVSSVALQTSGSIGSISDEDIARIVAAVLAALQATAIPVNTVQMNGAPIAGDGSEANRWRGVGVPN